MNQRVTSGGRKRTRQRAAAAAGFLAFALESPPRMCILMFKAALDSLARRPQQIPRDSGSDFAHIHARIGFCPCCLTLMAAISVRVSE